MSAPADFCPYVGLQPYTEADRDYFFGRQREQRIIASNLYAAPLTVLYGASGVGKSSVLLAGVVPHLRTVPRTAVVVFRAWQGTTFLEALKSQCLEAVAAAQQKPLAHDDIDMTLPFDDFLYAVGQAFGGSVLILFDQFEEYFLYHPASETGSTFDSEFARAINRDEVDAGFLIALREDALSTLDRFRARIPNLLSNTLRLQHMDAAAAEEAIRKPLEVYNTRFSTSAEPVTIEDELVHALLAQVRTGQVQLGQAAGVGQAQTRDDTVQIEAPFLQLVMTRLWEEERQANSRTLRLSTLERLGGAQEIVRTHLDGVMSKLDAVEQEVCSRFFDRLVTPSGNKIACSVDDLTNWAETLSVYVPAVLQTLSGSRILRSVAAPTGSNEVDYEIFNDVLAPAILSWRTQYTQAQEQAEAKRQAGEQQRQAEGQARAEEQARAASRLRGWVWALAIVSLLAIGAAGVAVNAKKDEERQRTAAEEALKTTETALEAAQEARKTALKAVQQAQQTLETALKAAPQTLETAYAVHNALEQPTATGAAGLLDKAQTEYAAAKRSQEAAPIVATVDSPGLIYIQIQDEEQRTRAQQIRTALKAQNFIAPGIERLKAGPTTGAEVRFFRKNEEEGAKQIVEILQGLQVQGVQAKYIPGYEGSTKIRLKQYEIWFAPGVLK